MGWVWYSMPLSFLFVNLQNMCNSCRYLSNHAKCLFKKTILHWNIGTTHGGPTCHWSNLDLKLPIWKTRFELATWTTKCKSIAWNNNGCWLCLITWFYTVLALSRVEGVPRLHVHDRRLTYWWVPGLRSLSSLHRLTFARHTRRAALACRGVITTKKSLENRRIA